jgi:hypothetical protein
MPSTVGDWNAVGDNVLVCELQRRQLPDNGNRKTLLARIKESNELYSLSDDSVCFRPPIILPMEGPAPPCFPETYETGNFNNLGSVVV